MASSYRVKITRVAHQFGIAGQTPIGNVRYSRDFDALPDALREASAWAATGEFVHYAPSNFTASVEEVDWGVVDERDPNVTSELGAN